MSISVKDFVPAKKKGSMFKAGAVQSFTEIHQEMNDWIAEANPAIVTIETVVLPNIHDSDEEGSMDTELWTGGESSSQWYQLIRVWYNS
ncbi:MAG: hypothetical protein OEY56_00035 [Cyclobacteriaceae bacterium]|nr:hypothetical protein [Cyclobacteriaceae bacterium]